MGGAQYQDDGVLVLRHCPMMMAPVVVRRLAALRARAPTFASVSGRRGEAERAKAGGGCARVVSHSEDATALLSRVLRRVAGDLRAGDALFLTGGVGAGKSVFCRNFIREVLEDEDEIVPSPTYLLQQTYHPPQPTPTLQHFDLYRFDRDPAHLEMMLQRAGFASCLADDVVLVEWAQRLPPQYAEAAGERCDIAFSRDGGNDAEGGRIIELTGRGAHWVAVVDAVAGILPSQANGGSEDLHLDGS